MAFGGFVGDKVVAEGGVQYASGIVVKSIFKLANQSIDPPSIAATSTGVATATVTGLAVGDVVQVTPRADFNDDLIIKYARVSAADTVEIGIYNPTGSPIDAGAQSVDIVAWDLT